MNTKVFIFMSAVSLAIAGNIPSYSYNPPQFRQVSAESDEVKYDFSWEVSDEDFGVDFGHEESREGDFTQGSYYVLLPDTRFQTVKYYVDGDSGFVADVKFEGEAQYPESVESREYSAPRPSYPAPKTSHPAPKPSHPAPKPSYLAPKPSYPAPKPLYSAPKSKESDEVPIYAPPRASYSYSY